MRYQSQSDGKTCLIRVSLAAGQFIGKQEPRGFGASEYLIISGKAAIFSFSFIIGTKGA